VITYGSLFSGVGGIDLGFDRAGMSCVWQVEKSRKCRLVLSRHWPGVPRFDDVTAFPPPDGVLVPDVLCGGFPCQDVSDAGRKEGIGGSRSGLWREYLRIVRLLRPKVAVVENVGGLLVRGAGAVFGGLAESGYDAVWDCLPAGAFGAHHLRDRVFVVAYRPDAGCFRLQGRPRPSRSWSAEQFEGLLQDALRVSIPTGSVGGVSDGVPDRTFRLRALGNAVVPDAAEWVGRQVVRFLEAV